MTDSLVTIARIGAPHGVKGHLKLHLFLENPEEIQGFSHFYLQEPGAKAFKPFSDFELSCKGGQFYVLLHGVHDRDLARQFTHGLLAVPREELSALAEDEFYWSDLEGLSVYNEQGILLGVIDHLLETGANDVLVLKKQGEQMEQLIPYVRPEIVKEIDLKEHKMIVDWEAES